MREAVIPVGEPFRVLPIRTESVVIVLDVMLGSGGKQSPVFHAWQDSQGCACHTLQANCFPVHVGVKSPVAVVIGGVCSSRQGLDASGKNAPLHHVSPVPLFSTGEVVILPGLGETRAFEADLELLQMRSIQSWTVRWKAMKTGIQATKPTATPAGPRHGMRAMAKKASQDKIVMAARKLFTEFGYDATTLRQIAKCAGLGLTTLFNHIGDKRDLIYLIFDEEVTLAAERSRAAVRPWQTFTEKISTTASFYFQMFSMEPVLSRILLSEVLQQTPGPHLERHIFIRDRMMQNFEELALEGQTTGELKPELDPKVIARSIHFAFTGASRWWITEAHPDWRSGQRYFEEILTLLKDGYTCHPKRAASFAERKARPSRRKA